MHSTSSEEAIGPHAKVGIAPLIVMMAGLASQSLTFTVPTPVLPLMALHYGAQGQFLTQMLYAVASLGLMLTSITSGMIVRAVGVRRLLILASLLFAIAGSVPAITSSVTLVLGSRFLLGGGSGLMTTGCTMLLAHSYRGAARSRALGYQAAVGSVASLATLIIVGGLALRTGWHIPFLLYGVAALPIILLSILGVPQVPLQPPVAGAGFGRAFTQIWPVCIAACLLMMVPLSVGSNAPFLLTAIGIVAPVTQAIIIGSFTVMSAAGGAVFGRCQSALGMLHTFVGSLLFGAVGMAVLALAGNGWVAMAGYALVGFATGLFIPHLWVLATTLVDEATRGYAIGLMTTSMFLGGFLYPFVVGLLQKAFGLNGALAAVGLALGIAGIAMLAARRTRLAGGHLAALA